LMCHPQL